MHRRQIGSPGIHDIVPRMEENMSDGVPQFATAEYSGKPGGPACKSCGQAISGAYYRVNAALTCAACAQKIKELMPKDSHSAFVRGVLFGVGGAILGLVIYVAFALATGWMVGYISLAVGYIVGKAIVKGSGGVGGRRYQMAAVLLTYIAVSLAAVPIAISVHMKQKSVQQHAQVSGSAAVDALCARHGADLGGKPRLGPDPHDPPAGRRDRASRDHAERPLAERRLARDQLGEVRDDEVSGAHRPAAALTS